jgi:hypothetical protein
MTELAPRKRYLGYAVKGKFRPAKGVKMTAARVRIMEDVARLEWTRPEVSCLERELSARS